MRRARVMLLSCVSMHAGCVWSSAKAVVKPARPVAAEIDPADELVDLDVEALPEDASCETKGSAEIPQGHVELAVCDLGGHSSSPEAEAQGFIEHDMRADLILTGKHKVATTIATWTNGWEWGTGYDLSGSLEARRRGAVVLQTGSSGPSPGSSGVSSTVEIFAVDKTGWHKVSELTGTSVSIDIDARDPGRAAVSTCEALPYGQTSTKGGCRGASDADPGDTTELRWNGRTIESRILPPPPTEPDANDADASSPP